ncbi:translocation protein TolB [Leptospira fletcheri]|uniref:Translocation protein TolB n=1 Tax=Leptospira fletcheri TaxID=2484981 RepID=A0A4R9GER0_9LEPT|nr:PD40 domain-containing protein [Leptospira fletcheri]TGK10279.1 translocation protein TolB [Leptospira fletcheri]
MRRFGLALAFSALVPVFDCALLSSVEKIKPIEFDYGPISRNYFRPANDKPFPLTVQRGNNLYNSTTKDGRYLFYTTGQKGNFDIWFRDLKSSVVVPVTDHPSSEYKPAISPDGTKLVFVSEQYDSSGDLVLLKMKPSEWAIKILDGKRFLNTDFKFLTNPEYDTPGKSDRFLDTDPNWSPDNRHIVFSSDRLSPGIPNLVLMDSEGKEKPRRLTEKGAASPFWSEDGKSITFISYSDSERGEVYLFDTVSSRTKRITKDDYLDFSPSLSPDGRYLYYTSIRSDSDRNGKVDERDNSVIVRLDRTNGKEKRLTSGNFSLFDTKFSRFNGGSVLFTASFYDTMNVYFLPADGSVPKAADIGAQYELALEYKKKQSFEDFLLALDSIETYFAEDPLLPVFKAKARLEKYRESKRKGRIVVLNEIRKEMLSSKMHPTEGLGYAYLLEAEGSKPSELRDYSTSLRGVSGTDKQSLAALEEHIGTIYEEQGDEKSALERYELLSKSFPEFYNIRQIRKRIGAIRFSSSEESGWKLPEVLIFAANDPKSSLEDLRNIYELLESRTFLDRPDAEKIQIADAAETVNSLKTKSPFLSRYFAYLKAAGLKGQGEYKKSNAVLDSFVEQLKPEDPLFLKSHILKSENFRGVGDTRNSLAELRIFLENYDSNSGVPIDESEMERSFLYFENLARNYENRSDFLQASFHYFFNAENMFLAKSKNLFLDSLYKDYAIYYQKLMVDTSFKLAKSISEKNSKGLLGALNPVEFDPLDKKEGLLYVTQYYEKEKILPRARTFLDLATLYGYAYYLINRSVIRETYYYAAGTMDANKKEIALRDYKQAEYELRWIIFADPTYHDAYQLLGWLYQYVDIMKSRKISEEEPSDEENYKNVYGKYFPEKNFEENVELYSQILELLGEKFPNKKALSDLRLNLANNYFLLKNYPKADEQYALVESYSKVILFKAQFEDYRQKAVFLFNSARSSIYMSRYSEAIRKLKDAAALYSENEFPKLFSQSDFTGQFGSYREKLALIYTLIGLSSMESGDFGTSIAYYRDALKLNESSKLVDPVNLYNALALSLQKIGNLSESEENLKKAEESARERGINWFPKKVKITVWDYFWDFVFDAVLPDSTRVSGSGRFPEAIPVAYQPLLSSGIRLNNLLLEHNYSLSAEEIDKRLEYVSRKGLGGHFAGKLIQSQSWNDLGFVRYKRGEFGGAKQAFRLQKDYETSTSELGSRSFSSFRRSLYSLFAEIEADDSGIAGKYEKELADSSEYLESIKRRYLVSCISFFEDEDKISVRKRCADNFYRENYDFDVLSANVLYYSGEEKLKKKAWIEAFENLGKAASLLENPSGLPKEVVGLNQDPFSKKERVTHALSRASIFYRLGDSERAYLCLNFAEEMANEFFYGIELIQTWVLQARLDLASGKSAQAETKIGKAEDLLRNQAHIIADSKGFLLRDLYETKARIEAESGDLRSAFRTWKRYRTLLLFRNFQKGIWELEEGKKEYSEFETAWRNFRTSYLKYQSSLERRSDVKEAEANLTKSSSMAWESLAKLRNSLPGRRNFLNPFGNPEDRPLDSSESEFKILKIFGKNYIRIASSNGVRFSTVPGGEKEVLAELSRQPEWLRSKTIDPGNTSYAAAILGSARDAIFKADLEPIRTDDPGSFSSKTVATFVPLPDEPRVREIKSGNLGPLLEDTDVVVSPLPELESDFLFGERKPDRLDLKEIFSKNHKISTAIFWEKGVPSWRKVLKAATVSIGSGIDRVYICSVGDSCLNEVFRELRGETSAANVYRFGKLSGLRAPDTKRAGELLVDSRNFEMVGNDSKAYDSLFLARNYTKAGSDFALRIEENLLRVLRKKHGNGSVKEILALAYEPRAETQMEDLHFAICLSALLEHSDQNCDWADFSPEKKEIISAVVSLKAGNGKISPDLSVDPKVYDPFLLRIRLAEIALETYSPEVVRLQLAKAAKILPPKGGKERIARLEADLARQISLLEESSEPGGVPAELGDRDTGSAGEKEYRIHLGFLAKKKSSGKRISPVTLHSEIFGASPELFAGLDSSERGLLVDLLRYSLSEESAEEMSGFQNSYLDFELKKGNLPRACRVAMEISRAYYTRGNYEKAKAWLAKAEGISDDSSNPEIFYLKYKLNAIGGKVAETSSDSPFVDSMKFYREAFSKNSKDLLNVANRWVNSRKKIPFSPREKRELDDFLVYLQHLAFQKNDSESFFDLAVAKDRISAVRKSVLGRTPFFSDIPKFESVSFRLEEKLPPDQELLAVVDLGLTSFYIKFSRGKSNGDIAYKDNRRLKSSIFKYHEEAEKGGAEILLRESLETEYRQSIRIAKNKITYLYLSSYHFLVPLSPRSEEEVYYVTDPAVLLDNPPHREKDEFLPGFGILFKESSSTPDWLKRLFKLDTFEIGNMGTSRISPFLLIREPLELDENKGVLLGGKNVSEISGLKADGPWMLSASLLEDFFSGSNHFRDSLYFLQKGIRGSGIVNLGFQTDTHNSRFLRELTRRESVSIPLRNRFLKAMDAMKELYPFDKYWNGYRLFTTSFVVR